MAKCSFLLILQVKKTLMMRQTLKLFAENKTSLFDAASALLKKLGIVFDAETAEPVKVDALYDDRMPKYLTDALSYI